MASTWKKLSNMIHDAHGRASYDEAPSDPADDDTLKRISELLHHHSDTLSVETLVRMRYMNKESTNMLTMLIQLPGVTTDMVDDILGTADSHDHRARVELWTVRTHQGRINWSIIYDCIRHDISLDITCHLLKIMMDNQYNPVEILDNIMDRVSIDGDHHDAPLVRRAVQFCAYNGVALPSNYSLIHMCALSLKMTKGLWVVVEDAVIDLLFRLEHLDRTVLMDDQRPIRTDRHRREANEPAPISPNDVIRQAHRFTLLHLNSLNSRLALAVQNAAIIIHMSKVERKADAEERERHRHKKRPRSET